MRSLVDERNPGMRANSPFAINSVGPPLPVKSLLSTGVKTWYATDSGPCVYGSVEAGYDSGDRRVGSE